MTIANGSDFDDFAGLEYRPRASASGSRTPGSFFGKRDPRPFLTALARVGARRRRALRRRLPRRRPRVGRDARPRRPARADPVRAAPPLARAAARLRGAAAADPRGRRPRAGRPLGEGLRVPRRRAADPRARAARRRRGGAAARDGRRRRRRARRRRRDPRGARPGSRALARRRSSTATPLSDEWRDAPLAPDARRGAAPSCLERGECAAERSSRRRRRSSSSRRSSRARSRRCTGTLGAATSASPTCSRCCFLVSFVRSLGRRPRRAAHDGDRCSSSSPPSCSST